MKGKYKKLLKNTGLFLFAQAGSKIISLLLIPFYSHVFSTEEYGLIDGVMSFVALMIPIGTLMIQTSVLRFVLDKEENPKIIISNATFIFFIETVSVLIAYVVLKTNGAFQGYLEYIVLAVLFESLNGILINYVKAKEKNTLFMTQGFLCTLIMGGCNILFLVGFKMGIESYFISIAIAYFVVDALLFFAGKCYKEISIKAIRFDKLKEMLWYSIPMIANSLSWTLMSIGDRYMIIGLLGLAANGIYSIATKIPTVISSLVNIFMQGWEISAIEEQKEIDKNEFYSTIFDYVSTFILVGISACLVVIRVVIENILGESFTSAWMYTPFLLLSILFSAYASFYGASYNAEKKTMGAFITSAIGALFNLILNYIFIKLIGLQGAAFATMLAYLIMWVIRLIHTRAYICVKVNRWRFGCSILLIVIQIVSFYLLKELWFVQAGVMIIFTGLLMIVNRKTFLIIIKNIGRRFKRGRME